MNQIIPLAPVVLFVYNRPEHTKKTIEALQKNKLALDSDLIIFSDAPKLAAHVEAVNNVRHLIRKIDGFKSVVIVEREENFGLARSIIHGVTDTCDKYGRVIVLEDDIVTSPYFLSFMNTALDKFSNESKVWHISGWNYPIEADGLGDTFFWRAMNCWGWATWSDRWKHYEKNPQHLIQTWTIEKIKRFNLDLSDGCDFWSQIVSNQSGEINTWAIFWYATIFKHNGLCLNPATSLVFNVGNDGSGENCKNRDLGQIVNLAQFIPKFPDSFKESDLAITRVRAWHRAKNGNMLRQLARKIKRIIFGKLDVGNS